MYLWKENNSASSGVLASDKMNFIEPTWGNSHVTAVPSSADRKESGDLKIKYIYFKKKGLSLRKLHLSSKSQSLVLNAHALCE